MENFIFLSPHYDDVCFSLGFVASKLTNLELINIFTHSSYAKPHILTTLPIGVDLADSVSKIRAQEDAIFAKRYKFQRIALGLDDAGLHGADPFNFKGIDAEQATLERILLPLLKEKADSNGSAVIFCPLAIGGHRNHVSTFNAIANHADKLENQGASICFYEDLPYASYKDMRLRRIGQLQEYFSANGYKRLHLVLDDEAVASKLEAIQIYDSQMRRDPPPNIAKYSPATDIGDIHEALWVKESSTQVLPCQFLGV